jgi:hypothetical protein
MLNIAVRSFCGISRADIKVSRVALLAGVNFAGKTSACRAIAAALSGRVIPLDDLKKGEAGMLVRTGEAEASVLISSDEGQIKLTWPAAERVTGGKPPEASVYATGLDTIVGMDAKERATALAPYLKSEPSHEDLHAVLKDAGVDDNISNRVWAKVKAEGWDAMHRVAKDYGASQKGAWEQITGTGWGDKKAVSWLPEHWTEDLAEADVEKLGMAAVDAKRALEEAIRGAAVDTEKVARLKADAALLPDLERQATAERELIEATRTKLSQLKADRAALPPAEADAGVPCPHCKKGVRMRQVKPGVWQIEAAEEKLSASEKKKRGNDIAVIDGQISNYRDKITTADNRLRKIEADQVTAQRAVNEIAGLEGKDGGGEAGAVDKAREALVLAEQRFAAAKAKRDADGKVNLVRQYQAITAALAPDGLRKTALARGLESFNRRLAILCDAAKWKAVTIEPDLSVRYGNRPYMLLSASEQYRARATLAAAMAQIDDSAMLIFDGADILDTRGRNGLFGLVHAVALPTLITMTISKAADMPNLAVGGYGASYWFDQDVVRPLDEVTAKKEAA